MSNFLSTPIFYPNGNPHVGHLYSALLLDTYKRLNILFEQEHFCTTGVDEHGQKVALAAMAKGLSPQEHVDMLSKNFIEYFKEFNISWDFWVRTTNPSHEKAVQNFWQKLVKNEYIYKGKYSGYYSVKDEAYVEKNDEKDPSIIWQEEECYYFKLSAFEGKLKKYFEKNKNFIYPNKRYNEALGFLNNGLRDFAISRVKARMNWGISVPDDSEHVIYVWIDALVNYLSAIDYPDEKYKKNWPGSHLLGKDILKFHAIYWPALLMAAELPLPEKLIVHGWWLNDNEKISKSYNNAVDLKELIEKYQIDGIRFFLLKAINLGEDGHFKEETIKQIVYGFLANKFGNIFLRIIGLTEIVFDSNLPECEKITNKKINEKIEKFEKSAISASKDLTLIDEYLNNFTICIEELNDYFQTKEIWLMKNKTEQAQHLYLLLDTFRKISFLIWPVMPEIAEQILTFFNLEPKKSDYDKPLTTAYPNDRPKFFPKKTKNTTDEKERN